MARYGLEKGETMTMLREKVESRAESKIRRQRPSDRS
jgi:hypothetical protein